MYVEERIYVLHPGQVPEFLRLYEAEGMAVQARHMRHMVGFYCTVGDPQDMLVHMWGYEDLDQRERCRAAMQADPAWQAYVAKIRPLILTQESRIMKCAPFFLERLRRMLAAAK